MMKNTYFSRVYSTNTNKKKYTNYIKVRRKGSARKVRYSPSTIICNGDPGRDFKVSSITMTILFCFLPKIIMFFAIVKTI